METAVISNVNRSLSSASFSCTSSTLSQSILVALIVVYVLLAPLFIFTLYIGYTKWKKQSSRNISYSDVLTLNVTTMESMSIIGLFVIYWTSSPGERTVTLGGNVMYLIGSYGQAVCHCLICVERYIAVVHPITYLRLKNKGGVIIRIIIVVFIWVFCIGWASINDLVSYVLSRIITGLLMNVVSLVVVSFCSISVLCVLIRPAPGEGGEDRKQVNQSKRASFVTIMAILGVLVLRFIVGLVYYVGLSSGINTVDICVIKVITLWFKLPSSLVVPLLFLHRAGKLPGCSFKPCFGAGQ